MDIGTIIAGLQAIASIADTMNKTPQLTPAQAEEKPKKTQQTPLNAFVILPNQTPPSGVSGLSPLLLPSMPYTPIWGEEPASARLRKLILNIPNAMKNVPNFMRNIPHNAVDMPVHYEIPPNMIFPTFNPDPSLRELYELFYGIR